MNKNLTEARIWLLAIAFVIGALLGFCLAEILLHSSHRNYLHSYGFGPQRGLDYWLMALAFSVSFGFLGMAMAGFDLLPCEDVAEKR